MPEESMSIVPPDERILDDTVYHRQMPDGGELLLIADDDGAQVSINLDGSIADDDAPFLGLGYGLNNDGQLIRQASCCEPRSDKVCMSFLFLSDGSFRLAINIAGDDEEPDLVVFTPEEMLQLAKEKPRSLLDSIIKLYSKRPRR